MNYDKRWVWKQAHEKYDVNCLISTVIRLTRSNGIGMFTKNSLNPLVKLERKILAMVYIDILKNHLL